MALLIPRLLRGENRCEALGYRLSEATEEGRVPNFRFDLTKHARAHLGEIGILGIIVGFQAHLRRCRHLLYWKAVI